MILWAYQPRLFGERRRRIFVVPNSPERFQLAVKRRRTHGGERPRSGKSSSTCCRLRRIRIASAPAAVPTSMGS